MMLLFHSFLFKFVWIQLSKLQIKQDPDFERKIKKASSVSCFSSDYKQFWYWQQFYSQILRFISRSTSKATLSHLSEQTNQCKFITLSHSKYRKIFRQLIFRQFAIISNYSQIYLMTKVLTAVGKNLVFDIFKKQTLAIHVGATIEKLERGHIEIKFPKHAISTQHHGYFHGGVISYLADISAGLAGISCLQDPQASSLTIQFKVNFLKAGEGDFLIGKGNVIQQTGSLLINKAEIYSPANDLVAIMLQTNKKLKPRGKK